MSSTASSTSSGIGFFGLLTIVLVIFKVLGYIDWSWWLVFSPMIFSISIALAFLLTIVVVAIIAVIFSD